MKMESLSGADLDYWTARSLGYDAEIVAMYGWRYCRIDVYGVGWRPYEPTQNELLAARIFSDRFYTVGPAPIADQREHGAAGRVWMAEAQMYPAFNGLQMGDTPWVAICRLRVAEEISKNAAFRGEYQQRHQEDGCYEQESR
ncbi:hypothetical protein [Paraburkholderia youngii]|uniref:hypothetical protein n=1 Tax=Paraburkholderia youngii TaxID=2782701 RepID=UPI00158FD849|nr:hypothetical protein [Paraburkholderia youngii]NUX55937.1 hypothetical protein [Paraburkholderia youngii]